MNDKVLLIDADSIAYRAAASAEGLSSSIAIARAYDSINSILERLSGEYSDYEIILSGENNFRKRLTSSYKANRVAVQRPGSLPDVLQSLHSSSRCRTYPNLEGDDTIGIRKGYWFRDGVDTIICGLDKDLRQFSGWHYNWVRERLDFLSDRQSATLFFSQFITGDRADNIGGFDGIARVKTPKFLEPVIQEIEEKETEEEMLEVVRRMYNYEDFRVLLNGNLLYLLRHEGDYWCPEVLRKSLDLDYIQEAEALYEYLSSQGMSHPKSLELIGDKQTNGFQ